MAYPFVRAFFRYGSLTIKPRAFVVHMAEGGGTVGYLSRDNPNGVSVHYVIERTGRVVQMLREDEASGSINPRDVRTTDDTGYTHLGEFVVYGVTANRRCLGDRWKNPNSAVLSCEVEGFAADGPNAAQADALVKLVEDIRTRHPGLPVLGHRDFADYKACPGRRIPWARLGGHAQVDDSPAEEPDPVKLLWGDSRPALVDIPVGVQLYDLDLEPAAKVSVKQIDRPSPFGVIRDGTRYRVVRVNTGGEDRALLVKSGDATIAYDPDPSDDLRAQLTSALNRISAAKTALG